MASAEFVDPYIDPETGLLRNKVGARTKVALDDAEGDLSFARLMQLMDCPPKSTGDLGELRADNGPREMDLNRFIGRLAHHDDQFNHIHPFREGNGRTQRVFWSRVASERRDLGPLQDMFRQIARKVAPPSQRDEAWHAAERARLRLPDVK